MTSIRCKLTRCDLDDCGICKRCGDRSAADHDWRKVERDRPCYDRSECSRCGEVQENPDHDWTPTPAETADGTGIQLKCSRCGLNI